MLRNRADVIWELANARFVDMSPEDLQDYVLNSMSEILDDLSDNELIEHCECYGVNYEEE